MIELTSPSKDLAERILTEVAFKDRLTGYRLRERTGITTIRLYSFEEVVALLHDPFPRIDFVGLESWIRGVKGDGELAEKIKKVIEAESNELERLKRIRALMEERLQQCKSVA